jgi:uroporphyrinogen-III synthase
MAIACERPAGPDRDRAAASTPEGSDPVTAAEEGSDPATAAGEASHPPAGEARNPARTAGEAGHPARAAGEASHPATAAGEASHPPAAGEARNPARTAGEASHPARTAGEASHPAAREISHPAAAREISHLAAAGEARHPAGARSVLITRPEPGARETAARVVAMGLRPVLAPALQITALPGCLPPASRIAALLVTSSNAVDTLPSDYHPIPLLAVGDATAARARSAGFTAVTSARGDARDLAALVQRDHAPQAGTLLLVSGRGQGLELASALRRAGFSVLRRVAYAAVPAHGLPAEAVAAIAGPDLLAALFFSAETARCFVRLVRRAGLADRLAGVDAISIGRPAAVALGALRWRCIRVAARPTQDEMLALLR